MTLLDEIGTLSAQLDGRLDGHRERGMVDGRRSSVPASRQSIVDLDALDAQVETRMVIRRWAYRVIERLPEANRASDSPARILRTHWDWAVEQPWGPAMVAEMEALRDRLANGGRPVRLIKCPICDELTRLDRLVVEHRDCLGQVPDVPLNRDV